MVIQVHILPLFKRKDILDLEYEITQLVVIKLNENYNKLVKYTSV